MKRERLISGVKKNCETVKITVIMKLRDIDSSGSQSQGMEKSWLNFNLFFFFFFNLFLGPHLRHMEIHRLRV